MEEFIKDLIIKGFTAKTIIARCLKKGWAVTDNDIETIRGKIDLELKIEQNKKTESKKEKIVKLFSEQETYFDFAKRMGVNLEFKDTIELISIVQKTTADIFLRQSICLMRALELQSEGNNIGLELFWKGYDVAFKGLCKAWCQVSN